MEELFRVFSKPMLKVEKTLSDLHREILSTASYLEHIKNHSSEIVRKLSNITTPSDFLKEFVNVDAFLMKYFYFLIEINCRFEMMQIAEKDICNGISMKKNQIENLPQICDANESVTDLKTCEDSVENLSPINSSVKSSSEKCDVKSLKSDQECQTPNESLDKINESSNIEVNDQTQTKEIPIAEVTPTKGSQPEEKCEINELKFLRKVGKEYGVDIEHVISPSEFYVRFPYDMCFDEMEKKLKSLKVESEISCNKKTGISKESLRKEIGEYVLYYLKCDEIWCRAKVVNWNLDHPDDLVKIFLIDYGKSKCVSVKDIKPLPEDLKKYPSLAVRCHLFGIFPVNMTKDCKFLNWDAETCDQMSLLCDNSRKIKIIIAPKDEYHPSESLPVTLWFADKGNKCLNDLLVKSELAVEGSPLTKTTDNELENWNPMKEDFESYQNSYELNVNDPAAAIYNYVGKDFDRVCCQFARTGKCYKGNACRREHVKLDPQGFTTDQEEVFVSAFNSLTVPLSGSVLKVQVTCVQALNSFCCVTDDPIWCADDENLHSLLRYMNHKDNVRDMKKLLIPPSVGQIVIAQYSEDDYWYRAKVLESQPEKDEFNVEFVDYGNSQKVSLSKIRAIEPRFLHLPFQCIRCRIFGIEPNLEVEGRSDEGFEYLSDWITEGQMKIEVISKFPGEELRLLINLFDLNGKNIGADLIAKEYAIYKPEMILGDDTEIVPG